MKIEKINENQIRCTLTKEDLAERELKLSELAYGSEKAKTLFRDMMQQASYEFGFEAEEIPLMIEAIPLSSECIVLIITKVEDPDELDTRFSKFTSGNEDTQTVETASIEGADGILDLYKKIHEEKMRLEQQKSADFIPLDKTVKKEETSAEAPEPEKTDTHSESITLNLTRLYSLDNLNTAFGLAMILKGFYKGDNSLYKDPVRKTYFLIMNKNEHSPEDFNKVCNIASEYGSQKPYTPALEAFMAEHYDTIIQHDALQVLARI